MIGLHSQLKKHVTYVYSERTFYWLTYPSYKTQKTVFVFEEYTFQKYFNFFLFLLMSAKIRGATATTYIPGDPILPGLQAEQVS